MPSPFNICGGLAFDISIVHKEFQKCSRLHHRAARLIPEKHEHIHQERLQVNSVTWAHHRITSTKCNHSRLASLKFPFGFILAGTWHCSVMSVT